MPVEQDMTRAQSAYPSSDTRRAPSGSARSDLALARSPVATTLPARAVDGLQRDMPTGSLVIMKKKLIAFRKIIWFYYRTRGRDFPWRPPSLKLRKDKTLDPYKILVSEIMLQQTQTERVEPKYREFLKRFPTLRTLARASVRDVLKIWQGLGYNRRALALQRCAQIILEQYQGKIPSDPEMLDALPGVGQSTAGAVAAFAFNRPVVFIETNIRRVFLHHFFAHRRQVSDEIIYKIASEAVDRRNPREWHYALMDYGAHLAWLIPNPNRRSKHYARQARFEGSFRQLRGQVLQALLSSTIRERAELARRIKNKQLPRALRELAREGFIRIADNRIMLL